LLSGFVGGSYRQVLLAAGGSAPYVWAVTSGSLPAGLTLDHSSGAISGTPTATGTATFNVSVTGAGSTVATKSFTLLVVSGTLTRVGALAQFAAGGSWDTTVWITNNSASDILPVRVLFHADDGSAGVRAANGTAVPLTVTQKGDVQVSTATTFDRVINPNTSLTLAGGVGFGASNAQGWVELQAGNMPVQGSISAMAVFRYAPGGLTPGASGFSTPWEATVPLLTQNSSSTLILPFDNTSGFGVGIAVGTFGASTQQVTASFYDVNGNTLGTSQHFTLAPTGHTAFMINTGPAGQDWSFTANQQGVVKFTGTALTGVGLRASPYGTLTTLPAVQQ
jgi:hypothetical protein